MRHMAQNRVKGIVITVSEQHFPQIHTDDAAVLRDDPDLIVRQVAMTRLKIINNIAAGYWSTDAKPSAIKLV